MALTITITDAGRAEVINAANTGTAPVEITEIGLGTGNYSPSPTQTALQTEIKRLNTISGEVVADDTIHVTVKDESSDDYDVSEFGLFTASGTLFAVYSVTSGNIIEKSAPSTLLMAVDIILSTLDATNLTFGSTEFTNPPASETVQGVTLYATEADHQAASVDNKAATPAGVKAFTEQFGIGGYKAVADANLATESGLYSLPVSLGAANSPVAGQSGTLQVIKGGSTSDYVSQVWIQSNDTDVFRQFIRHYRGDSQVWSDWLEMGAPVPESFTLTIGPTGDLPTLNDAIRELSARYPLYSNTGVKVVLELEAGFVIQEQVIARGIDLSWIEITGVDAETVVDRASLTVDISNGDNIYPVFGVSDGGKGPRISQLFSMNRSGSDFLKRGVYAVDAGSAIHISSGCGIKNVYGSGCLSINGANISGDNPDFSGATEASFYTSRATISFTGGCNGTGSGIGLQSESGGRINVPFADVSGCLTNGILCVHANISCTAANARKGVSDDPSDIKVSSGGIIQSKDATGGTNVTKNTLNPDGIIFD